MSKFMSQRTKISGNKHAEFLNLNMSEAALNFDSALFSI